MRWKMIRRKPVLLLLCVTVFAPIVLYNGKIAPSTSSNANSNFLGDASNLNRGTEVEKLHAFPQESLGALNEPAGVVYLADASNSVQISARHGVDTLASKGFALGRSGEHKNRVLAAANEGTQSDREGTIQQVTSRNIVNDGTENRVSQLMIESTVSRNQNVTSERKPEHASKVDQVQTQTKSGQQQASNNAVLPDARVRQLKDQLIRAKVYLGLASTRSNPHFIRELRVRIREVQRALGDAIKDSELPKNINEKIKTMEQTLLKGKQIQDDCAAVIKKLRAMLHSMEDQLRVHRKQTLFLTQLAAKTLPKGLHCLPLKLSTEYYSMEPSQQEFPNQEKLEDSKLYHFALFSDNILAAAVVVNSTVSNAKNSRDHVFHIVTDRLNYAAMKMWFLANPPGKATIQVQNIEEFTWLNASYSPVLEQLGSQSMIDYYFRTHRANSDANLKYRNPKYLSILNHLRFYLPEIFPNLDKVVFLDDDIVVQKDLTALWSIDLKGKVNGAVETCGENFHRFDRYLNFSNPLIAKNFDPRACGWAYGMNVFDLAEWRKQKITEVYHSWQRLNHDRLLWKLGTLPPGLITFWKRTFPLDRSWHLLGLGYNPTVNNKAIERAAVIHYNGNMKPWLEIGMPKYRNLWSKYVNYDQVYLRDCNINP